MALDELIRGDSSFQKKLIHEKMKIEDLLNPDFVNGIIFVFVEFF